MNPKRWESWLRGWLQRHSVQEPPEELWWNYTRQVMNRIEPQPVWVFRPQHAFRLAGVLVAALAMIVMVRSSNRAVQQADQEAKILSDAGLEQQDPVSDQDLEKELRLIDESELAIS